MVALEGVVFNCILTSLELSEGVFGLVNTASG